LVLIKKLNINLKQTKDITNNKMNKYQDDDFKCQPKFVKGVKQKGGSGGGKSFNLKKNKSTKEIYNSKHIRVTKQKILNSKSNTI